MAYLFSFAVLRKVSSLALIPTLVLGSIGPVGAGTVPPLLPFNVAFGSQALAPGSLEQPRRPFAPALTIRLQQGLAAALAAVFGYFPRFGAWQPDAVNGDRPARVLNYQFSQGNSLGSPGSPQIPILSRTELRNWLIDIAAGTTGDEMNRRAQRRLNEFLKPSAEEAALYLTYRIKHAWDIPRSISPEPSQMSSRIKFHDALTRLNHQTQTRLGSLAALRRDKLEEIWKSYVWKFEQGLAKAAGIEADEITLELDDFGVFTLHVWIAHWSPTIEQFATGFSHFLWKTIPDADLTGRQEILYSNRDPSKGAPPREGGHGKKSWIKGIWSKRLPPLLGHAIPTGIMLSAALSLGSILRLPLPIQRPFAFAWMAAVMGAVSRLYCLARNVPAAADHSTLIFSQGIPEHGRQGALRSADNSFCDLPEQILRTFFARNPPKDRSVTEFRAFLAQYRRENGRGGMWTIRLENRFAGDGNLSSVIHIGVHRPGNVDFVKEDGSQKLVPVYKIFTPEQMIESGDRVRLYGASTRRAFAERTEPDTDKPIVQRTARSLGQKKLSLLENRLMLWMKWLQTRPEVLRSEVSINRWRLAAASEPALPMLEYSYDAESSLLTIHRMNLADDKLANCLTFELLWEFQTAAQLTLVGSITGGSWLTSWRSEKIEVIAWNSVMRIEGQVRVLSGPIQWERLRAARGAVEKILLPASGSA